VLLKNNKKALLALYLIFIHVLVILCFVYPELPVKAGHKLGLTSIDLSMQRFYLRMKSYYFRQDKALTKEAILFIGDSHIQGLPVLEITNNGVNYGIGGDTTSGVKARLSDYQSIRSAEVVVLAIGINDLLSGHSGEYVENTIIQIVKSILPKAYVLISEIHPVDEKLLGVKGLNTTILEINQKLRHFCMEDERLQCTGIGAKLMNGAGQLSSSFHIGDGLHLNSAGNKLWIEKLKIQIIKIKGRRDEPIQ
jgi:lysophospholipase L1-like esterase